MAQAPASAARETYVVGHDGSRRAADALALATWLARARRARVVVVRVIAGRAASAGDGERRAEAAAALGRIVAAVADVPCAARVVDATSAARGLQRVAAAEDAVLLVVGATRRPAGPGQVDGVPEALVRDASVAVAVAPAGWAAAGPREDAPVACAFDDSPEAAGAL
ncbi:MAG TPA: universal stress protein, partial [Solirubrobacteraceae bacterium]|nr:universal stress protein [Solirubrobacteraceae bacterium]